jgi:hypothetical protein
VRTEDGAAARAPAAAPEREPGPGRRSDPLALRVLAGVLIAVAAAGLALVECFLVPLRIGSVRFPIVVPLAMAGNILLARLAGRQTGSVAGAAVPPVLWLAAVIVLSWPRAEGDVIVEGTLTGLVFLFAGAVAGAYGVASEITRRTRPAPPGRR